ncbi:hypothetical protein PFLA_a0096 [Pseudoalteromonas flavipulchra NCIMB 2033 = ATCC BAA-314]|nr:hypothetical protein [Pseudoalteromonas flavipulchra NCIMB 2033 = ATCC BAA-314]
MRISRVSLFKTNGFNFLPLWDKFFINNLTPRRLKDNFLTSPALIAGFYFAFIQINKGKINRRGAMLR